MAVTLLIFRAIPFIISIEEREEGGGLNHPYPTITFFIPPSIIKTVTQNKEILQTLPCNLSGTNRLSSSVTSRHWPDSAATCCCCCPLLGMFEETTGPLGSAALWCAWLGFGVTLCSCSCCTQQIIHFQSLIPQVYIICEIYQMFEFKYIPKSGHQKEEAILLGLIKVSGKKKPSNITYDIKPKKQAILENVDQYRYHIFCFITEGYSIFNR